MTGVTNLSEGSLIYGSATEIITELASGNNLDVLTMGATTPSWQAVTGSDYEKIASETLGSDLSNITLSFPAVTGSAVSNFILTFNGAVDSTSEEIGVQINGLTGSSAYIMERLNIVGGSSTASTHTGSYWKPCPANNSMRFFGNMYIQVGQFGTADSIYMTCDFVSTAAHYVYSGYISGSTDTTLSEVKLYTVGAGGNIKSGSCASLFKINI